MTKCNQCGVFLRDRSPVCPLCHCVVPEDEDAENTYPDIRFYVRRLKRICNVWLFVLLMCSAVLLFLNYTFYNGLIWSLIPVGGLCYCYLLLRYVMLGRQGHRSKVMVVSLFTVLLVILIDWVTGFHRWSLNYVFPGGMIVVDGIILLMMLVNKRNWQSYITLQILMLCLSLGALLLWKLHIITDSLLCIIALAVSLFLFLGTLIIGDRPARTELWRRFHI